MDLFSKNIKPLQKKGKHLDLGCNSKPRNPFSYDELFGIDIGPQQELDPAVTFRQANLSLGPIPFGDCEFDSVSAFDFIEHIPRILPNAEFTETRFPFIELMNEIWRVLKPGGVFYAVTPAFPSPEAFQDPTHVNIITNKTHEYFCGADCFGRYYGFQGNFEEIEVRWVLKKNVQKNTGALKQTLRKWHRRVFKGQKAVHLLWVLKARK